MNDQKVRLFFADCVSTLRVSFILMSGAYMAIISKDKDVVRDERERESQMQMIFISIAVYLSEILIRYNTDETYWPDAYVALSFFGDGWRMDMDGCGLILMPSVANAWCSCFLSSSQPYTVLAHQFSAIRRHPLHQPNSSGKILVPCPLTSKNVHIAAVTISHFDRDSSWSLIKSVFKVLRATLSGGLASLRGFFIICCIHPCILMQSYWTLNDVCKSKWWSHSFPVLSIDADEYERPCPISQLDNLGWLWSVLKCSLDSRWCAAYVD